MLNFGSRERAEISPFRQFVIDDGAKMCVVLSEGFVVWWGICGGDGRDADIKSLTKRGGDFTVFCEQSVEVLAAKVGMNKIEIE